MNEEVVRIVRPSLFLTTAVLRPAFYGDTINGCKEDHTMIRGVVGVIRGCLFLVTRTGFRRTPSSHRPRWRRMRSMTTRSSMRATIRISREHLGHSMGSASHTFLMSSRHFFEGMRRGRCSEFTFYACPLIREPLIVHGTFSRCRNRSTPR